MDKKIDKSIIRKERRMRLLKIGVPVAVVVFGIGFFAVGMGKSVLRSDLSIGTVDAGPLTTAVHAAGRVVPAYEEIINAPATTSILRVFAQPGDTVVEGQPLIELDLRDEQTEYDKLVDSRNIRARELTQLHLNNSTAQSELAMQIEVKEMEVSRLAIEVENERRLDSLGSGTGDRVRQAETAHAAGVLELRQMRLRLENDKLRAEAAADVQALGLASVEKDLEMRRRTLHQANVPAPHGGILTYLNTEIGSRVGAGERVAVVSDLSQFKITGEVPEGSSNRVTVGSQVTVRLGRDELNGTVTNITPQAKGGVVSFVVRLDDPRNARLRSGLRVQLYVSYGYKDNVVRVPSGAFFKGPGEYEMFVLDGDDRLERRKVRVADSNRDYVEVVSGLHPGDRVVLSDMDEFHKYSSLRIK